MASRLPNALTFFRLAAAPGVALAFALAPRPLADALAFGLFAAAALTDWLDGWLARRLDAITPIGRMMDPIADKAMVAIALAALLAVHGAAAVLLLPAAAILFREVAVSGLREFLAGRLVVPVTFAAKAKTTAQMLAIGALLLAGAFGGALDPGGPGAYLWGAGLAALWAAAAMTVWTGWDYFRRALADPTFRG